MAAGQLLCSDVVGRANAADHQCCQKMAQISTKHMQSQCGGHINTTKGVNMAKLMA
jgi:hypothetical protein